MLVYMRYDNIKSSTCKSCDIPTSLLKRLSSPCFSSPSSSFFIADQENTSSMYFSQVLGAQYLFF